MNLIGLKPWLSWMVLSTLGVFLALGMAACSRTQPGGITSRAASDGESLYQDHCAECHEQAQPDLLKQPPNLHGIFSGKTLPSGAPATDTEVRKTIIEGRGIMPAFDKRLSNDEVDDLVAYLHTLK